LRSPAPDLGAGPGAGLLGYPLDHKTLTWKETHWRTRAYREYPWTLSCMQARPAADPARLREVAAPRVPAGAGMDAPLRGRGRRPLPALVSAGVRACAQLVSCAGVPARERGLPCRGEGARKGQQVLAACTLRQ